MLKREEQKNISRSKLTQELLSQPINTKTYKFTGVSKVSSKTIVHVIYASRINIDGKVHLIGCSRREVEAAMMYNIIAIDNQLVRKLNYVGITIEEQKAYLLSQGFNYDRENNKFYKHSIRR